MRQTTDYYDLGRHAAECGVPSDGHDLIIGTVQHRDWKRGHEDWHLENDLPTQKFLDLELLEIAGTGDA